jgi:DNA transposition AAA+ family ATPase
VLLPWRRRAGKTDAVKAYANDDPDVIPVEAAIGMTAKAMFSELAQRVGLDGEGSTNDLFVEVCRKLKGSDRMIIIDEAENLAYRTLEFVRRTYDMAKIGVLLVGTRRLITNLRGRRGQYAQLYSRSASPGDRRANGMDVSTSSRTSSRIQTALKASTTRRRAMRACCQTSSRTRDVVRSTGSPSRPRSSRNREDAGSHKRRGPWIYQRAS